MTFAELCANVRAHLGQRHRYEHCVRVARLADLLAQRHRLDAAQARLAGMLHDLARLYPEQRLLAECSARGMRIDGYERANPIVLHARLSAELAREDFGVTDSAVLSAIAKHTVAAPEMTALDSVIYLADGLEPGRAFDGRAALVELAMLDLKAAMRETLAASLRHLQQRGIAAAPQTAAAIRAHGTD